MNKISHMLLHRTLVFCLLLSGCTAVAPESTSAPPSVTPLTASAAPVGPLANVLSVSVSGNAGNYQFSVEIQSPDQGCQQYADWWEVLDEDGNLIYRRILGHSHVEEQPFTRSGGTVNIQPSEIVWVRAHMNPGGYGGFGMKGSVAGGFQPEKLAPDFAAHVADEPPLPQSCAF